MWWGGEITGGGGWERAVGKRTEQEQKIMIHMYDNNMMKAIVYKLIQNKIVKKKKNVTVAFFCQTVNII